MEYLELPDTLSGYVVVPSTFYSASPFPRFTEHEYLLQLLLCWFHVSIRALGLGEELGTLRDRVRNFVTWEDLVVKLLIFYIERGQLKWTCSGHALLGIDL